MVRKEGFDTMKIRNKTDKNLKEKQGGITDR
jgi:hypothetical protein